MAIDLDHTIVPARDKTAAARQLAQLLGVPWGPAAVGPFAAVYVHAGLTLDFMDTGEDFQVHHFCFRVDDATFDTILARLDAAAIPWRGEVRGVNDRKVGTYGGGRNVYWNQPDGHQWEILTRSYARQPR